MRPSLTWTSGTRMTTVVLLTKTPEGSVDFDKGWPLERSVSMLIKQSVGEADWPTIIDMGLHSSLCKRCAAHAGGHAGCAKREDV